MTVSDVAPAVSIEVHFTEGFFNDEMGVFCDGSELIRLILTTRLQSGLADTATFQLESGKEVTLECKAKSLTTSFHVDGATPFVRVAMRDGTFDITASDQSPGYL